MIDADTQAEVSVIGPGGEITFKGGTRKVRLWKFSDGGFLWEFEKDGNVTPLHLSQAAMNAVLELHNRLAWAIPDVTTDEAAVTPP